MGGSSAAENVAIFFLSLARFFFPPDVTNHTPSMTAVVAPQPQRPNASFPNTNDPAVVRPTAVNASSVLPHQFQPHAVSAAVGFNGAGENKGPWNQNVAHHHHQPRMPSNGDVKPPSHFVPALERKSGVKRRLFCCQVEKRKFASFGTWSNHMAK
jgi:hypothetical protein